MTAAEARRKNNQSQSTTFPALEQAQPEIIKLTEKIATIEAGYEKELADTRKQVEQRYSEKLNALDKQQRGEFESKDEFKANQEKKRSDLVSQRDTELARLNVSRVAEPETASLKARIKALTEHEYIVGAEGIEAELGSYDSDEHQFTVKLRSKNSVLKLRLSGTIPLQSAEAKAFKQQWQTGLIRPEAKAKPIGELVELTLVNDADNSRLIIYEGRFMTSKAAADEAIKVAIKKGYVFQGGLTWMPVSFYEPWLDANDYCTNTTINGQTGWRLPTKDELKSLYDSGAMKGQGGTYRFWSSTPGGRDSHYIVLMFNGVIAPFNDTSMYYVTCVR
jgi:hypothetical protein